MSRNEILTCSALGIGMLFASFSFLFEFGHWEQMLILCVAGGVIGVMIAPIYSPEHFIDLQSKQFIGPVQITGGTIAGFLTVLALADSFLVALIGAIAGATAGGGISMWCKAKLRLLVKVARRRKSR